MSSPFIPRPGEFGASEDDGLEADYSLVAEYPEEVDYYALLGLSRTPRPSDTDIRSAYRNLTLSFHPDKQPPHLREAAEHHFTQIQDAYTTLIDPKKREVYDLLGAEGVRQEWARGGAMGIGGEAQHQQVGVKTMSADQFRRWFLKTMKARERKAVDSMVLSRGHITLGINASDTISVNAENNDVTFQLPSPRLSAYALNYNFKAPIPIPKFWSPREEQPEDEDSAAGSKEEEEPEPLNVTIQTGIAGMLKCPTQKFTLTHEDDSEEERIVPLPLALVAKDLVIGASASQSLTSTTGIWGRRPFSVLNGSTVTATALLLPVPTFQTGVQRAFQPIPGINPFNVNVTSTFTRSLLETPPSIQVHATKQVAETKIAFCTWSSGMLTWPEAIMRLPFINLSFDSVIRGTSEADSLQIGLMSFSKPDRQTASAADDEEEQDEELHELSKKQDEIDRAAESWQAVIQASPSGGTLSLTYSRNLFSGKPADDPVRAEWSSEGYYPIPNTDQPRAVRLEVSGAVDLGLSLAWSVMGVRRIGKFTRMGLGVGIAEHGITMNISWRRLGQRITVPITLCPVQQASQDAAVLATIFPWLAYCAIEFGYIRPRDRKRRRQAAARRHNELKKLIPKKREESQQAIELILDQVQKRQAREQAQDGLVITKAEYGYVPPTNKKAKNVFAEPRVIDVTVPVAGLVDRGQLIISQDTIKFKLLGFYDPAPLLPKRLKIWYRYQGQDHFVDAGEKDSVACPMRSHLVTVSQGLRDKPNRYP